MIGLSSRHCVAATTFELAVTGLEGLETTPPSKKLSSTLLKGMLARCACPALSSLCFDEQKDTQHSLPFLPSNVSAACEVRLVAAYNSPLLETTLATPPARSERHRPTRRPAEAQSSRNLQTLDAVARERENTLVEGVCDMLLCRQFRGVANCLPLEQLEGVLEGTCEISRGCCHDA